MPRPKGSKNGTNRASNSKLANAVRAKRTATTGQHAVTDVEPTSVEIVSDYYGVTNRIDGNQNESNNDSGNLRESASGSGNAGNGSGTGLGSGSNDSGSGVTADSGSGSGETAKRRGRPRRTELGEETPIRVRKPKKVSVEVEEGVEASILIMSGLLQGISDVSAMLINKPYVKLHPQEGNELGSAILDCLAVLPKTARKKFDAMMSKYYPFWNLATVVTKIAYPRYAYYQMEREANAQTQSRNVTDEVQPASTGETSFNGYAQTDERASD